MSILLAGQGGATDGAARPLRIDLPTSRYQLPNGMTVVVQPDPSTSLVAVELWFRAGFHYERPDQYGLAHYFEHLFPWADHIWSKPEGARTMRAAMIDANAQTRGDNTRYYLKVPANAAEAAVALMADRIATGPSVLDAKRLDDSRGIVLNEIRNSENTDWDSDLDSRLSRGAFGEGNPYAHNASGLKSVIQSATPAQMQEWFNQYHGASNAILLVSGNVDPKVIQATAERYFGSLPAGKPAPRLGVVPRPAHSVGRDVINIDFPTPRLYRRWAIAPFAQPDSEMAELAGYLLAGGPGSRLHARLVDRDRSAVAVTAASKLWDAAGQLTLQIDLNDKADADVVDRAVLEEIRALATRPPSKAELDRAKSRCLADYLKALQQLGWTDSRLELIGDSEMYTGDPGYYLKRLRHIEAATPAELSAVTRRWLQDRGASLEVRKPPALRSTQDLLDRTVLPSVGASAPPSVPPIHVHTLKNGFRVAVVERPGLPLVHLRLLLDPTWSGDSNVPAGLPDLCVGLMTKRTRSMSETRLTNAIGDLGGALQTSIDSAGASIGLTALSSHLDDALTLLERIATEPAISGADFDRAKADRLERLTRPLTPDATRRRVLLETLLGADHPVARSADPEAMKGALSSLTLPSAEAFVSRLRPSVATLLVVGDVKDADLVLSLERTFGTWKGASDSPKASASATSLKTDPAVMIVDRPGATQADILVVQPIEGNTFEKAILGAVATTVGSRLNANLRESKQWAYGASASISYILGNPVLTASSTVQGDKAADAMAEIRSEIEKLAQGNSITAADTQSIRRGLLLGLTTNMGTIETIGDALADARRKNVPYDKYFPSLLDATQNLSAETLAAACKATLAPNRLIYIIIGDRQVLEPQLQKRTMNPVVFTK